MGSFTPAQQRHNQRVLRLSIVYAVVLLGAVYLFKHGLVSGAAAWVTAIVPGLVVSGFFLLFGRYLVDEHDEYVRLLVARQTLIATGILLSLTTIWGFLESFGLVGHVLAWIWAVVWLVGFAIGGAANFVIERQAR